MDGNIVIFKPHQTIVVDSFPSKFTFTMSFGIYDLNPKGVDFGIKMSSPSGEILAEIKGDKFIPEPTDDVKKHLFNNSPLSGYRSTACNQ